MQHVNGNKWAQWWQNLKREFGSPVQCVKPWERTPRLWWFLVGCVAAGVAFDAMLASELAGKAARSAEPKIDIWSHPLDHYVQIRGLPFTADALQDLRAPLVRPYTSLTPGDFSCETSYNLWCGAWLLQHPGGSY